MTLSTGIEQSHSDQVLDARSIHHMSTSTEATQQPTRLIFGTGDAPLDTSPAAMSKRSYTCPACLGPKVGGRALCERCGSPEALSAWVNGGDA